MIEVTILEILLLVLACIAFIAYLYEHSQLVQAKIFIRHILANKELRDRLVADYEQHRKEMENA